MKKRCNTIIKIGFVLVLITSCKNEEFISKKSPIVMWEDPADIYYGTLLSSNQLNATSDLDGKFEYIPALGTKLEIGDSRILKVIFTPNDTVLNDTVSKTVKINVLSKLIPQITWENPADIGSETLLSSVQLNATADVPGTFEYTPSLGTKLNVVDNQILRVTFIPIDTIKYDTISKTVSIKVIDSSFKIGIRNDFIDVVNTGDIKIYPIYGGHHSLDSHILDVDNDGISDFQLISKSYIGVDTDNQELFQIMNPTFQASIVTIIDTTFTYVFTSDITIGDQIVKHTFRYYVNNSKNLPDNATISSTSSYSCPEVYMSGDTLTHTESWSNGTLTLAINFKAVSQGSETTISTMKRGNWVGQDMKYILIKKIKDDTCRYGWIKLSVNDYKEIHIYEYALQKE